MVGTREMQFQQCRLLCNWVGMSTNNSFKMVPRNLQYVTRLHTPPQRSIRHVIHNPMDVYGRTPTPNEEITPDFATTFGKPSHLMHDTTNIPLNTPHTV
jgi:hypothetical protein